MFAHKFETVTLVCACMLVPVCRFFINLGLRNAIRSFFGDPEWCRQRGKHRSEGEGSWWKGEEVARLRTHISVDSEDMSGYELMADWLEPYKSVAYSVGVIGIRCADIEPRNKVSDCSQQMVVTGIAQSRSVASSSLSACWLQLPSFVVISVHEIKPSRMCTLCLQAKSYNMRPVIIIPGPKAPRNIDPYVEMLLDDFNQLPTQGLEVTEVGLPSAAGQQPTTPRTFMHYAFLSACNADAQARIKLAKHQGVNAYLPCGWCINQSISGRDAIDQEILEDGGCRSTMRPMGYDKPTRQTMHRRYARIKRAACHSKHITCIVCLQSAYQ